MDFDYAFELGHNRFYCRDSTADLGILGHFGKSDRLPMVEYSLILSRVQDTVQ